MNEIQKLEAATAQLSDLGATFEYPGFISISRNDRTYDIGDANGAFGYDVRDYATGNVLDDEYSDTLPLTASVDELVLWIRQRIAN